VSLPARSRSTGSAAQVSSDLAKFPRPSVAVDVALLTTIEPDEASAAGNGQVLAVLLQQRSSAPSKGDWGLPGSFVRERERLADAVLRTLADKCAIEGLAPQQLRVFDDPARDERGWVLTVAHLATVPAETVLEAIKDRADLTLAPLLPSTGDGPTRPIEDLALPGRQRSLPFDHAGILDLAVADLRNRYRSAPDPDGLVAQPFSLLGLRRTHEAVLGETLQKDTFRRQMNPGIEEFNAWSDGTVGRPARLYRKLS